MGLQMRNGPQTWPLLGHGSLGWLHPCDGEISPRQYTALIRRASSLRYHPEHLLKYYNDVNDIESINCNRCANADETCVDKSSKCLREARLREMPLSCSEKKFQNNVGNKFRMTLTTESVSNCYPEKPTEMSWVRNNRLSKSLKTAGNIRLKKEANGPSSESNMFDKNSRHNSQLFVKLSSGAHLYESNKSQSSKAFVRDFKCTIKQEDSQYTIRQDKLVQSKRQNKENLSRCSTVQSSLCKDVLSCQKLKRLDVSKAERFNVDQGLSSKSNVDYTLVPPSLLSYPWSFSSPIDISTHQRPVYERPYYDCGYDTDSDSTPLHSSPECLSGKLKAIDAYPVWSRYKMWLQRLTKAQG